MRKRIFQFCRFTSVVLFIFALSRTAEAVSMSFSNPGTITIPASGTSGKADPYPSTIPVNLPGSIVDLNVTLFGLSHWWPADLDILLVGPGGQKVILMSDVLAIHAFPNVTLTFDDSAASPVPLLYITSGTYRPRNIDFFGSDSFPAPAPAGPFSSVLSVYNGTDPNGDWSLYVFDDSRFLTGSIANGWRLDIETFVEGSETAPVPEPSSLILLGAGLIGLARWGRLLAQ